MNKFKCPKCSSENYQIHEYYNDYYSLNYNAKHELIMTNTIDTTLENSQLYCLNCDSTFTIENNENLREID